MQTNVSHRLLVALENHPMLRDRTRPAQAWLERAWKVLTLDLGHWLIAHAPKEIEAEAPIDPIDLASADSFPASDPPASRLSS